MSHKSHGTVLRTPKGKYVRAFQVIGDFGDKEYLQETPDLSCATIFRDGKGDKARIQRAKQDWPYLQELGVEVERTVTVVAVGPVPAESRTN